MQWGRAVRAIDCVRGGAESASWPAASIQSLGLKPVSFASQIEGPMVELMHKLLDDRQFGFVEGFSNFLYALKSGRWEQLPNDERLHWIKSLSSSLGQRDGLASFPQWEDRELLQRVSELVCNYQRGLEKQLES